jgi:hypothetical protein
MTRRLTALFIGLNVLGVLVPLFGDDASKRPVEVVKTERVDFAAGGVIRLNDTYGYLSVDGWDEPQVEVTITKSTNRFYKPGQQEEAKRSLESIRVVTERLPENELSITTILASRKGTWSPPLPPTTKSGVIVEYLIHAPHDSRLVIHHGTGQVLVSNMTGDVEATSLSGDILLMLPDSGLYSIDAKSKLGSVSSDFAGDSHRRYLVGTGFANATPPPSHRIYVRTGRGGIAIKADPSDWIRP